MKAKMTNGKVPSSFRDPSGFVFFRNGVIYRQINAIYKENYDELVHSGLHDILIDSGLLLPHDEIDIGYMSSDKAYKIVKPELIPFISYPYEWCFSQLKNAALTTLEIQKTSLNFGMSLKDCSAYNIQFRKGKPVFIDTLSFERYQEGRPWVAYRQFCQHFLAPLALMTCRDIRLNQLFRIYIDGIPLDLACSLLPFRTRLVFSLLFHLHLHARSQRHFANKAVNPDNHKMSRQSFLGLIDNLESAIKKLCWRPQGTQWANYYEDTNYSVNAFNHKKHLVDEILDSIRPKVVWDLGANTGVFSRIASAKGIQTISFDNDPVAVERSYIESVERNEINIQPLLLDLTNPSPNIGWGNEERISLLDRGPVETALGLSLIHHLALSNNVPLGRIASFFDKLCTSLVIEFIPKSDSQVQKLLSTRQDIYPDYKQDVFENEFTKYFTIRRSVKITDSERTLYLMSRA